MGRGKKQHFIYKIHFLCGYPTGRYYLGKHTGYIDDTYGGSGRFCFAYYKKYGKIEGETYIREILEINPSKKINNDREKVVIGELGKTDPLCMNQCPGGMTNGFCGEQHNAKVRQYDLKTGKLIKEGNSISEAEQTLKINNISRSCAHVKGRWSGGGIGRYASEGLDWVDPKEALCKQSRAVIQYDRAMNELARFDRIQDAVIATGVDKKAIQECCAGRHPTGKGFVGRYVDENYVRPCNRDLKVCGAKEVAQYDLEGNLIKIYPSGNEAAKQNGLKASTIRLACKRDNHITMGYIGKYMEDDEKCQN